METIYIKRFIKTEDDLPKDEGEYFVFLKGDDELDDAQDVYFYRKNKINNTSWLLNVIWYLQPVTLAELIKEKLLNKEVIRFEHYKNNPVCDESGLKITDFHPGFIEGVEYVINKLTE